MVCYLMWAAYLWVAIGYRDTTDEHNNVQRNCATTTYQSITFHTSQNNGFMYWLFVIERSLQFAAFLNTTRNSKRAKPLGSRGIVEVLLYALSSVLSQQLRPISFANRWVYCCIPRHKERPFYNNGFLEALFQFNFAKKITTQVHENQTCVYSKQRGQGWWRALSMASRQSGRQASSCSFIFSLVHDFF